MLLAYDFPLLSIFLVLLEIAALIIVIFAIIWAFIDNFTRRDHSGWAKAGWALLILVLPLLGVIIYIAVRPAEVVI